MVRERGKDQCTYTFKAGNTPPLKRRGQLSPYLIVSVLLIIAIALLFYTGQLQRFFGPLRVAYPVEVEAVAHHIQDCASRAGTEAVIAIASQGGFLAIPPEIEREHDSFLSLDDLNMRIIPFWMHHGRSRIPTTAFMEQQISQYSLNKTLSCIDAFRPLGNRFVITEEGNLSIATTLTDDTVYLSVTYPLKVIPKTTLKETRMQDFSSTVPARLKRTYELAKKIMQYENKKLALENLTIDLMSSDPDIPLNHLGVECKQQSWNVENIKEHLSNVMAANLLTIRVKNTDHVPFEAEEQTYQNLAASAKDIQSTLEAGVEDFNAITSSEKMQKMPEKTPSDAFEYFHGYWDVGTEKTPMAVAFEFHPEYGMDLTATPNQFGTLTSTVYRAPQKLLGFLCLHAYHFTYSIRYPVKISIYDPGSFGGKGLTFDFSFPVLIRDNAPEPASLAKRYVSDIRPLEGFCTKYGTTFYEIRAVGIDQDGFLSNAGLEGANITYRCAGRRCTLGTTRAEAGMYALITPLPSGCKNPAVIAEKEGYLMGESFVRNSQGKEGNNVNPENGGNYGNPGNHGNQGSRGIPGDRGETTLIPLTRLKTLELHAMKTPYFGLDKKTGEVQELAPDENLTIRIQALDKDYQQSVLYPLSALSGAAPTSPPSRSTSPAVSSSIISSGLPPNQITLIEGNEHYRIDAVLTKGDRIIGGGFAENLTITGKEISQASAAEINVVEYRPTPITDAEESAMALYLTSTAQGKPILTLR